MPPFSHIHYSMMIQNCHWRIVLKNSNKFHIFFVNFLSYCDVFLSFTIVFGALTF